MSFLALANKRKSCRKYLPDEISKESLDRCIEAARLSPSACNSQPWRFIIVKSPELKNRLAEKVFSGIYSMNAFAKDAPVLVVVVRERSKYAAMMGGTLRGVQYSLIDIGIAIEHFALQAAEEGLGTCWIGWFNEGAVKKILSLSRKDKIDIILSVGHPQDLEPKEKKRKTKEEISVYI